MHGGVVVNGVRMCSMGAESLCSCGALYLGEARIDCVVNGIGWGVENIRLRMV